MPPQPPLGEEIDWTPPSAPEPIELRGSYALVRPAASQDAESLYAVTHPPHGDPAIWTYLHHGPYESADQLRGMLDGAAASKDPLFFAIAALPGEQALGMAAYMRIEPAFGVLELGNIFFGSPLQRTIAATEAIFLLVRHAFDDLGYRRVEWKCNALNAASRRAAERFGFAFEGVFRKHQVVKGRSRDTAWFAITDDRWPALRRGYEAWLAPGNFDAQSRQRRSLAELTRSAADA